MFKTFSPVEFSKISLIPYIRQFNNLYNLIYKYERGISVSINPESKIRAMLGGYKHFKRHKIDSWAFRTGSNKIPIKIWENTQLIAWNTIVKSSSVDAEKLDTVISFLKRYVDHQENFISIQTATVMLDAFYNAVSQKESKFSLQISVADDFLKPGADFSEYDDNTFETSYSVYKKSGRNRTNKKWRYIKEEFIFDITKK